MCNPAFCRLPPGTNTSQCKHFAVQTLQQCRPPSHPLGGCRSLNQLVASAPTLLACLQVSGHRVQVQVQLRGNIEQWLPESSIWEGIGQFLQLHHGVVLLDWLGVEILGVQVDVHWKACCVVVRAPGRWRGGGGAHDQGDRGGWGRVDRGTIGAWLWGIG